MNLIYPTFIQCIIVPTAVDAVISVCILFVRYTRGQFKDAAFLLGRDFD